MSLNQLKSDVEGLSSRLRNSAMDQQVKQALTLEVLPLLSQLIDEVVEMDAALAEVADQQESYIDDELSQQVLGIIDTSMIVIAQLMMRIPEDSKDTPVEISGIEEKMSLRVMVENYQKVASSIRSSVLEVSGVAEEESGDK